MVSGDTHPLSASRSCLLPLHFARLDTVSSLFRGSETSPPGQASKAVPAPHTPEGTAPRGDPHCVHQDLLFQSSWILPDQSMCGPGNPGLFLDCRMGLLPGGGPQPQTQPLSQGQQLSLTCPAPHLVLSVALICFPWPSPFIPPSIIPGPPSRLAFHAQGEQSPGTLRAVACRPQEPLTMAGGRVGMGGDGGRERSTDPPDGRAKAPTRLQFETRGL